MALTKIFKCSSYLFSLPSVTYRTSYSNTLLHIKEYSSIFYKMNTVYFQNEKGDDKFHIKFEFSDQSLNVNKVVNFERNMSECLKVFLVRLEDKLSKLLLKKMVKKKKQEESDVNLPDFKTEFFLDNEPLASDVVFQDIFDNKINGSLKLRILDNDYKVVINAPIVKNIMLPDTIRIESAVYPSKFEAFCLDKEMSDYVWFKSKTGKNDWSQCGEGFFYIPTEEDVQCFLKFRCTPKNKLHTGPICEVVSETPVEKFDGLQEIQKRHEFTKNKTNNDEFRVISYNILADSYTTTKEAKSHLFTYCDPIAMDFNYRKDLLNAELRGYNADLICLQEVGNKNFKVNLLPFFRSRGFYGSYFEKEGMREGCAFFYDNKKFKLLSTAQYVFTQELLENPLLKDFKDKIMENLNLMNRINNLQSQIQVGVLECLTQSKNLIVLGNTHLYFHPDADHIRLLQGLIGFQILLNVCKETQKSHPEKQISLLLCGDFNSTPECGFHLFLNEGSINSDHIDWKSKADEVIENISLSHSLNMKSACGTPQYTNYTKLFKACLDYIYFQTDYLEVKQIVPLPTEEVLSQYTAIPSKFFPSDHVALIADLKFKPT